MHEILMPPDYAGLFWGGLIARRAVRGIAKRGCCDQVRVLAAGKSGHLIAAVI